MAHRRQIAKNVFKLLAMSRLERISYNFQRLRKERKWTQVETARRGGVNYAYIGNIESCRVNFGARAEEKWATVFGVDITELLALPRSGTEAEAFKLYEEVKHYSIEDIRKLRDLVPVMFGTREGVANDRRAIQTKKEKGGKAGGGNKST